MLQATLLIFLYFLGNVQGGTWTPLVGSSVNWSKSGNVVQFTIIGPATGYIAMAISNDTLMGLADDSYVCGRNALGTMQLNSGYLFGHGRPAILQQNITASISVVDNVMTCVFDRPLTVTKNVSGTMTTWDLSTNSFHLLYAHGSVESNGDYDYHYGGRSASHGQFNFTNPNSTATVPVVTMTTTPASILNEKYWIPLAGSAVNWTNSGNVVQFTMTGPAFGYIAMAISTDKLMGPADDSYICGRNTLGTVQLNSGYLFDHAPPAIIQQSITASISVVDNVMTCVFDRPLTVTKNVSGTMTTWDLSTNSFHLLYAHGSVESNGDYDYHFRNRSASPSQFNFNDPTSTSTVYELTTTPRSASSRDVISIFCIVTSVIFSMTL